MYTDEYHAKNMILEIFDNEFFEDIINSPFISAMMDLPDVESETTEDYSEYCDQFIDCILWDLGDPYGYFLTLDEAREMNLV